MNHDWYVLITKTMQQIILYRNSLYARLQLR
jgi:hypothetical protein